MPHRKDNLGDLIRFARKNSRFYHEQLKQVSTNATSVVDLPITKPHEYWSRLNEVTTAPITSHIIMRSGSPTDSTKKVYLTKEEISKATSSSANALVSQGTGLMPGDRVANIPHRKYLPKVDPHLPNSPVYSFRIRANSQLRGLPAWQLHYHEYRRSKRPNFCSTSPNRRRRFSREQNPLLRNLRSNRFARHIFHRPDHRPTFGGKGQDTTKTQTCSVLWSMFLN